MSSKKPSVQKVQQSVQPKTTLKTEKKLRKKPKRPLMVCLSYTRYDSVGRVTERSGFRPAKESENWNLLWADGCLTLAQMIAMRKFQKINHFPGMNEVCRKDLLARNLNRMRKLFPTEYNFFPQTWCLPLDYSEFVAFARRKRNYAFIIKPDNSSQGRGIWVTRNYRQVSDTDSYLVQKYIAKPLLIDGYKFDLRMYVCVTACDPLRIYLYREGLARFATASYEEPSIRNISNCFMHLTNYSINKSSNGYIKASESKDSAHASKRSITSVMRWLSLRRYDVAGLWNAIDDVIVKTLISAENVLRQNYKTIFLNHNRGSACFEILGFDILIDRHLKPYLLEVNHSPSFHTDSKLDVEVKEALIEDTLRLVNFEAANREECLLEEKKIILARKMPTAQQLKQKSQPQLHKFKSANRFSKQSSTVTAWSDASAGNSNSGSLEKQWSSDGYDDALKAQLEYEDSHLGNYRRIFPIERMKDSKSLPESGTKSEVSQAVSSEASKRHSRSAEVESSSAESILDPGSEKSKELIGTLNKYEQFFSSSNRSLYRETASFRARAECARLMRTMLHQQRDEIKRAILLPKSLTAEEQRNLSTGVSGGSSSMKKSPVRERIDKARSIQPVGILASEEDRRLKYLSQRANLLRRTGVVRIVNRLMSAPNVTSSNKNNVKKMQTNVPGYYRLQEDALHEDLLTSIQIINSTEMIDRSGVEVKTSNGRDVPPTNLNSMQSEITKLNTRYCNTPSSSSSSNINLTNKLICPGNSQHSHKSNTVKNTGNTEARGMQHTIGGKLFPLIGKSIWSLECSTDSARSNASSPDRSTLQSADSKRGSQMSPDDITVIGLSLDGKGLPELRPINK